MILFGLFGAVAPTSASAQTGPASDAQQAEAITKPAVVFIQTRWTGYVLNASFGDVILGPILSGREHAAPRFTVTTSCSGFIINPDGYVVTAGHCVDDQSVQNGGKGLIIQAAVHKLENISVERDEPLSKGTLQAVLKYGYANWTVEGEDSGSPPERLVGVFPTQATFGTVAARPLTASVVNVLPFIKGDVALLKIASETPMPALELAPQSTLLDGTPVVAAGYPGSVSQNVDPSSEPSMKDGRVSGRQTVGGAPFTEVSAAVSPGMSGGPVVDMDGRVVGTASWRPGGETQPFNFITDTGSLRSLIAASGVTNILDPPNRTYRAALSDYFAGRYHAAAAKFGQLLTLEPDHALAKQYRRLAISNFNKEIVPPPPPAKGGPSVLLFVLIGGSLIVLAAVVVLFFRRRRSAPARHSRQLSHPTATPEPADGAMFLPALDQLPTSADGPGPTPPEDAEPEIVPLVPPDATGSAVEAGPGKQPDAERREGTLRLFVTYAREDRPLVDQLRVGLQRLRHEVWMDNRLSVGEEWWLEILAEIRRCDAIVVALSPAVLESQASALERDYGRRLGKVVLPVCVRPVRSDLLPPDLAKLQMVDYSDPGPAAAFELADVLAHLVPVRRLPDPLPEPPPVPMSYLGDLAARVHAPALSLDEQLALVARLRTATGKAGERQPATELLHTLQRRHDLYHEPAREIESVLAAEAASASAAPAADTGSGSG
jgi:hypothetical protein